MNFTNGQQLLELCDQNNLPISQIMFARETKYLEQDTVEVNQKMHYAYSIMKHAIRRALTDDLVGMGGMIGGESKRLNNLRMEGKNICGTLVSKAITYAVGVLEVNASMGLIVAAPTAGSSGVLPGVLIESARERDWTDEQLVDALFTAGAIGLLFARNATISGAGGGCQAETGVASAMAASAAVELLGGTPKQCLNAASTVLMNMLGLVCDPVGGLVEYPCQYRNATGVANALVAAELALSGVPQLIPFDEMLNTMYTVGKRLPAELRETALGGCAVTPTACAACQKCN